MSSNWASTHPPSLHPLRRTHTRTAHTSAKLSQVLPYHHHPFRYDASSFPTQTHPSLPSPNRCFRVLSRRARHLGSRHGHGPLFLALPEHILGSRFVFGDFHKTPRFPRFRFHDFSLHVVCVLSTSSHESIWSVNRLWLVTGTFEPPTYPAIDVFGPSFGTRLLVK